MPNSNGRFVWHELSTTNVDAAKAFYSRVLPWTTQPYGDNFAYTMWVNGETPFGGLLALDGDLASRGVPPHWLPYVKVYDVDECVRQVPLLGGQVRMGPTEVPGVGTWAVIADPQGAVLGVYEPETERSATGDVARGGFSWHELMTTDYKAAFEFYRALFHWESVGEHDMGNGMGVYCEFGMNGRPFGGMFNKSPEMPPPNWVSYVKVDDADKSAGEIAAAGGQIKNGPIEVPGGDRIAVCLDPQGVLFAIHASKVSA